MLKKLFSSAELGANIVAAVVVLGFVVLVSVLALHAVAESTLLTTVVGILGSKFSSVVDYFLGSSASSAQKSAQISHLIGQNGAADPAAPPSQPGA